MVPQGQVSRYPENGNVSVQAMSFPVSGSTRSERRAAAQRWRSRLRLWSGCVLFLYVTLHLSNHTLGLISLDAMEAGRLWFLALWRTPVGTAALYTALLVHILLALWSIYRRRTLRMPTWEATQVLLGFATAGREAAALARRPGEMARLLQQSSRLGPSERARLEGVESEIYMGLAA